MKEQYMPPKKGKKTGFEKMVEKQNKEMKDWVKKVAKRSRKIF